AADAGQPGGRGGRGPAGDRSGWGHPRDGGVPAARGRRPRRARARARGGPGEGRGTSVTDQSPEPMAVRVRVNGRDYAEPVPPRLLLSDFLRYRLRLTGTHVGCEHG